MKHQPLLEVPAIKVQQWLPTWDEVRFDQKASQAKPPDHFLVCSMKASHLKALTGVYQRSTKGGRPRVKDPNVQRWHEESRSTTIRDFVRYGYPWCEMSVAKRASKEASDLRKPGWIPTAILVNILTKGSIRNEVAIPDADLVRVEDRGSQATLHLPQGFGGPDWQPHAVYPFEVIDGQHRLWAFDEFDPGDKFELPVVAFCGLDRAWQAYLFWSVNITPKKINRSLAFDLYPLLRQQTWLDQFAGHSIYRETRCQELVEALWSHPDSPWYQRINMLGETKAAREYKGPTVSQAAWIRSLMVTFVKQWEGSGTRIGGLFGAPPSAASPLLPWSRPMQAALLISAGNALKASIGTARGGWADALRSVDAPELFQSDDQAFYGEYSLIASDQGIRGLLFTVNDLLYIDRETLKLDDWRWDDVHSELKRKSVAAAEEAPVTAALKAFAKTKAAKFLEDLARGLATYDWRASATPGLAQDEKLRQSVFRGSSGYKEMRRQLLVHLKAQGGRIGNAAGRVARVLDYE